MLLNFHLPHYFKKAIRKEIGEIYAHSFIASLALSIVLLFEPIFLYNVLHFSIPEILLFMALVYAVYIVLIPWGGRLASVYGYKHAMAMSVPFQILYWLLLLAARQNPGLVFIAAIIFGIQKTLYWPGFHSLMARYADREQVGSEFGAIYALTSLSQIAGPFMGGYLSQHFGMSAIFITAAIIYCAGILPLFSAKEIFIPKMYEFRDTWALYKTFPKKFLGYLGFGEELLVLTIWPIFIFTIVKNYEDTGLLATGAAFVAALLALAVGRASDLYHKRVMIKIGAVFTAFAWFARFMVTGKAGIFTMDTLSRTSKEMAFIPISTVTYIRAENNHIVPYVVFFEQSLSVGKLIACILGIIIFSITGGSFMALFILGGLFSLLYMLI